MTQHLPAKLRAAFAAVAVLGACLVAAPDLARAADPALVAAAEKEGELVVYGGDISETPHQIKRFMEVYPKIKATFVTAGGWQLYNRYMSEHSAGQAVADAFTNVEDTLLTLDAGGHLAEFKSDALKNFPAGIQVGNFVRTKLGYAALVSNTSQMKGLPVPDDWTSFINAPKVWEDRVAYVDPRGSSVAFMVLAAMYQTFGEEKAKQIYTGLKSTRPEVSMNTPASVTKLVSGERPLMMYILTNHVGDALRKGAPLEFTIPTSGSGPILFRCRRPEERQASECGPSLSGVPARPGPGRDHLARGVFDAQQRTGSERVAAARQGQVHQLRPQEGIGRPEEAHCLVAGRDRHPIGNPRRTHMPLRVQR